MSAEPFNIVAGLTVGEGEPLLVIDANANGSFADITSYGNVDFTLSQSVELGDIANLVIGGGNPGQILATSGNGSVYFANNETGQVAPGGNSTQIQYNGNGEFAGSDTFTFDTATSTLFIGDGNANVSINSGNIAGTGDFTAANFITVANGALFLKANGFSTQLIANSNLAANITLVLPANAGVANQLLQTDGTGNLIWATPVPQAAGSNTWVQYNANGLLGADSNLTYDYVGGTLTLGFVAGNANANIANTGNIVLNTLGELYAVGNIWSGANVTAANLVSSNLSGQVLIGANGFYTTVQSPNALASNLSIILPSTIGSNGQVLTTDGAGNTSWATPSESGGTGPYIHWAVNTAGNGQAFSSNNLTTYTLGANLSLFRNGVFVEPTDYTRANANSIVVNIPLAVDDTLDILATGTTVTAGGTLAVGQAITSYVFEGVAATTGTQDTILVEDPVSGANYTYTVPYSSTLGNIANGVVFSSNLTTWALSTAAVISNAAMVRGRTVKYDSLDNAELLTMEVTQGSNSTLTVSRTIISNGQV